jgi:predicted  nucleic acid-binding Zn-ribbon protein
MDISNTAKTKSHRLKFIGLYVTSVILIGIIMSAFWVPLPSEPVKGLDSNKNERLEEGQLLNADKSLHTQLNELYKLNEQYSSADANTNSNTLKAMSEKITKAEQALQKSIGSLEEAQAGNKTGNLASDVSSITTSFKNALIANTKFNASKAGNNSSNNSNDDNSKETIVQLTEDVQKRDERIKELEDELRISTQNKTANTSSPDIKKLKQENASFSSSLKDQLNKNEKLAQTNNAQKQTIQKLNKQIDAFRKFNETQ